MAVETIGLKTAGILYAGVYGLEGLGQILPPLKYNELNRNIHGLLSTCIVNYQEKHYLEPHLYPSYNPAHGLLAVIEGEESQIHIARLALALKQSWNQAKTAENVNPVFRAAVDLYPLDLSIGINYGVVVFDHDPWAKDKITPEGLFIGETKRIQVLAEKYAPQSLLLATLDIKEAAERANLGLVFAPHSLHLSKEEKGDFVKDPAHRPPYLFPVLSYPQAQVA